MNSWPSSLLPLPLRASRATPVPAAGGHVMESSRVRVINYDLATRERVEVEWDFEEYEWQAFQSWHLYKTNNGAEEFTINLNLDGTLQSYTARFENGVYSWTCEMLRWRVKATLEVEESI